MANNSLVEPPSTTPSGDMSTLAVMAIYTCAPIRRALNAVTAGSQLWL